MRLRVNEWPGGYLGAHVEGLACTTQAGLLDKTFVDLLLIYGQLDPYVLLCVFSFPLIFYEQFLFWTFDCF